MRQINRKSNLVVYVIHTDTEIPKTGKKGDTYAVLD